MNKISSLTLSLAATFNEGVTRAKLMRNGAPRVPRKRPTDPEARALQDMMQATCSHVLRELTNF